jgi:hypothetical protein
LLLRSIAAAKAAFILGLVGPACAAAEFIDLAIALKFAGGCCAAAAFIGLVLAAGSAGMLPTAAFASEGMRAANAVCMSAPPAKTAKPQIISLRIS